MKKMILILLFTLLFVVSPLIARPQFFFGGGVEWGKLYPGENEKEILSQNNRFNVSEEGSYVSHFVPSIEATYIPVADIGLGLTASIGYGGVLGFNNGSDSITATTTGLLSFLNDSLLDASCGIRYMTVMAKDRYLSFNAYALYNYSRYKLIKGNAGIEYGKRGEGEYSSFSQHSISLGVGLMERYDAYYFKLDLSAQKPLDFSNGLDSLSSSGWRITMSAKFGVVFTILNENEFMR